MVERPRRASPDETLERIRHEKSASTWRQCPTVLIVDDDPFIRKLIATTLEDVAGFELRRPPTATRPSTAAEAEPPELVFLDIDMPRLDGIEVCRRLRAGATTADTPRS